MRKMAVVLITVSLLTGLMAGCGASQSGQNTEQADAERTAAERSDAADTASGEADGSSAEKAEPETELHIYSIGEDFKNRIQFFYPEYTVTGDQSGMIGDLTVEYTVTGDQSGMIGDLTVQWHVYSDEQEYRDALDEALAKRKDELEDVKIRSGITSTPRKVLEVDTEGDTFTYMDWHFTGYDRKMKKAGNKNVYFNPLLYRNLPYHYRQNINVNVAMMMVSPMDEKGYFSFSLSNSASAAIAENADIVILEVNKNMPNVYDLKEGCIHISEVDYIVEYDSALPVLPPYWS